MAAMKGRETRLDGRTDRTTNGCPLVSALDSATEKVLLSLAGFACEMERERGQRLCAHRHLDTSMSLTHAPLTFTGHSPPRTPSCRCREVAFVLIRPGPPAD
jgi:hypothetical protein